MPRFAANLSMLYNEHAFLDRFAAAAADGFDAVEYLFPYAVRPPSIWPTPGRPRPAAGPVQRAARRLGEAGERGLACLPGRDGRVPQRLPTRRCPMPQALGCQRVHVMAGLVPAGADRAALRPPT
jgi:hydroxypyruvate isomerase